jgi:hypothetical protein
VCTYLTTFRSYQGFTHLNLYAAVIKAWAFSKRSDSTNRAEEVLEQMIQLSEAGALVDVAPNSKTFATMIMCYGFSKKPGSAKRADELFQQMLDLHREGELKDTPSRATYSSLRKTWLYSNDPNKSKRVAEIDAVIKEKFGPFSANMKGG